MLAALNAKPPLILSVVPKKDRIFDLIKMIRQGLNKWTAKHH